MDTFSLFRTIKGVLFATLTKHSIVSKVNLLSSRCILIKIFFVCSSGS